MLQNFQHLCANINHSRTVRLLAETYPNSYVPYKAHGATQTAYWYSLYPYHSYLRIYCHGL